MAADAAGVQYNVHDAKTKLSRIINRVEHGEEIIISRAGTPVAKVIPLAPRARRTRRGSLAGSLVISDDWDAPEDPPARRPALDPRKESTHRPVTSYVSYFA